MNKKYLLSSLWLLFLGLNAGEGYEKKVKPENNQNKSKGILIGRGVIQSPSERIVYQKGNDNDSLNYYSEWPGGTSPVYSLPLQRWFPKNTQGGEGKNDCP